MLTCELFYRCKPSKVSRLNLLAVPVTTVSENKTPVKTNTHPTLCLRLLTIAKSESREAKLGKLKEALGKMRICASLSSPKICSKSKSYDPVDQAKDQSRNDRTLRQAIALSVG